MSRFVAISNDRHAHLHLAEQRGLRPCPHPCGRSPGRGGTCPGRPFPAHRPAPRSGQGLSCSPVVAGCAEQPVRWSGRAVARTLVPAMLRGHPFAALHDTHAAVVPCIDEAALNALSTTDYAGLRAGGAWPIARSCRCRTLKRFCASARPARRPDKAELSAVGRQGAGQEPTVTAVSHPSIRGTTPKSRSSACSRVPSFASGSAG